MKIIRSTAHSRVTAPVSTDSLEASAAWLSSMSDRGWRVLIDFRNWPSWIPAMRAVQLLDQESPARGTLLRVDTGRAQASCSIDHWDPPRSLHFSVPVVGGEIAYGFTIQQNQPESELLITLELERSIHGISRLLAFFLQWRLRRLGARLTANLMTRMRPSQV